ncbi:MAG: hypothetical protein ACRCUY_11460 [Thermoguttaceae bacterium]
MDFVLSRRDFLAAASTTTLACCVPSLSAAQTSPPASNPIDAFVCVSQKDARYFELSDGSPYIPIGVNMIGTPWGDDASLTKLENDWFKKLQKNRANFIRVWLSNAMYEVEQNQAGNFVDSQGKKIDKLFALAKKYGIRLKLCTEHFRNFGEGEQRWADRSMYLKSNGGPAENISDYFLGEAGRAHYKKKLAWFVERFGSDPTVFGWELWNEMNAVYESSKFFKVWSTEMLAELHRLFPKNLAMQSLGSFDDEKTRAIYKELCELPGNDVLQVHRYLDLGAKWDICHASVAEGAAQAVQEIMAIRDSLDMKKPILLAEAGAVEPNHTGPFKLYQKDTFGIIFHDVLFAPFFAGAAGPGHCWHWDNYIHKNDLWWHLDRFASVVENINPAAQSFVPFEITNDRLFTLGLKGNSKTLIWCRDKQNTWKTELEEERTPEIIHDFVLDLASSEIDLQGKKCVVFDPWTNRKFPVKTDGTSIRLPDFSRSAVVIIS